MENKSLPKGRQGKPVHLLLDEGALLIINPPAPVEKDLHIQVKSMEPVIRWRSVHTLMTTLRNYAEDREFPHDLLGKAQELLEEYKKDSEGVSKVRAINLFKRLPEVWSEGMYFRTGEQKSVRKTEPLFSVIREDPLRVIQTMQGFTREIVQQLDTLKIPYRLVDKRLPFTKPDLRKITGTRFSQKRLVINGLQADQSGLVGAPTRYGKSRVLVNWIRCYPNLSILVVIPGADLLKQTTALIRELNPGREVKMIGGGSTVKYQAKAGGVTVCSVDSLHKIVSPPDLILADEPHSLVSESRITKWDPLMSVRRLAVGATLSGRFDGRDRLITGLFGPVLDEVTYREAVEEGAICPLVVFFLEIEVNTQRPLKSRNKAYNELLFENRTMANTVCRIMRECVPGDWQSMTFVSHEKQADLYLKAMGGDEATIAMAKKLPGKQRDAVFARMQSGEIKRCFATNIYAQGVTFSDLRLMINAEGGGNNTSAIQKPGRLAEIREGKPYGLVVDFLFTPDNPEAESRVNQGGAEWYNLVRDSRARRKAYEDKGYEVLVVRDMPELKSKMRGYMKCP